MLPLLDQGLNKSGLYLYKIKQASVNTYLWLIVGVGIKLMLVHRIIDNWHTTHNQGFINPLNLEIA